MADPGGKNGLTSQGSETWEEDEVIELTEVISEGESETLIELPSELKSLDSLDFRNMMAKSAESPVLEPDQPEEFSPSSDRDHPHAEQSSLTPEEPPPPTPGAALSDGEAPELTPEPLAHVVEAHTVEEIVQAVAARFDENRLREIVAGVVEDVAERICRELFPQVAEALVSREIEALKQSLEDEP